MKNQRLNTAQAAAALLCVFAPGIAANQATQLKVAPPRAKISATPEEVAEANMVATGTGPGRVSLLVHFDPSLPPGASERGQVKALVASQGGKVRYEYRAVMTNVINVRNVPEQSQQGLKNMPGVVNVQVDLYHNELVKMDEATPLITGLQSQVAASGFNVDGNGVRVCVCDTGIDSDHIMYANRIDAAAGYDFYNNDANPEDDHGHGTHVAGIAVGGTGLSVNFGCEGSEPFQGVAPGATLIGAKILNQYGGGYDSDIIAGIDHCADQSPSGGQADVINLSIGTGYFSSNCNTHSWAVAANNAVANGVVVVAASGNENNANAMGSPACGSDVIAVGATYKNDYPNCEEGTSIFNWGDCVDSNPPKDQVVCFSNQSDNLDVTAPGSVIWSASTAAGGSSITGKSGTSMASPYVAGLAALLLERDASLTPAQVRQLIRDGATDLGPAGFDRAYGYGRIDVTATLALVDQTQCATDPDCNNSLYCDGEETCDNGVCVSSGDPCLTDQFCNEVTDTCDECLVDADCNDSNICTLDSCPSGTCSNVNIAACDPATCGNGVCDGSENCNACPSDCVSGSTSGATCGNNICETANGESSVSCPGDCNGTTGGKPSNRWYCGTVNGVAHGCSDPGCDGEGNTCTEELVAPGEFCCGDETCASPNEDSLNCSIDCGASCSNVNEGCSAVSDCCSGLDCHGDGHCFDPSNVCTPGSLGKNAGCTIDDDCASCNCKNNGRCA